MAVWTSPRRPSNERFIHTVHGRMFNQTWKWAGEARRFGQEPRSTLV